mmetsp:Transcript_25783/g.65032  ORF Transcript_25783/g.65032 Transcript_25783/m.65032 type:complete len:432 (-) Transcript_25783:3516-4811(-)
MAGRRLVLAFALLCLLCHAVAYQPLRSYVWQEKTKGTLLPSHRYAHVAGLISNGMVVSHGYYFDRDSHKQMWLDDTFLFDTESNTWTEIATDRTLPRPSPRSSACSCSVNSKMYVFGGDDGGSRTGASSYMSGYYFQDLWSLQEEEGKWKWTEVEATGTLPAPRANHACACSRTSLYAYAGVDVGDVWEFKFDEKKWEVLIETGGGNSLLPRLFGATMERFGDHLYIFGGHDRGVPEQNILYRVGIQSKKVERFSPPAKSEGVPWPSPRSFHATVMTRGVLLLFGGAYCSPGCTCLNDIWGLDVGTIDEEGTPRWELISSTKAVVAERGSALASKSLVAHRYRHTMEFHSSTLYVFGGETYNPYLYHKDVMQFDLKGSSSLALMGAHSIAMVRGSTMGVALASFVIGFTGTALLAVILIVYVRSQKVRKIR